MADNHHRRDRAQETITMELTPAEANIVKRIRQLTSGQHLAILAIGRYGLDSLSVLSSGKTERLNYLPIDGGA